MNELGLAVILGIELRIGAKDGVGSEDKIHSSRRPLHGVRLPVADFIDAVA